MENEGKKYVWEGAIPLQIHLHDSEVTTLPPPSPALAELLSKWLDIMLLSTDYVFVLILAPRIGYLPLLSSQLKPFFSGALPPGVDTIWFEYKGLPLKWYIPTGVLFDLLCAEPERPWNLTVHFRGYPGNILIPCDGEDSVKWSYINSLKEAAYIIHGSSKNVMNMSHPDQVELWRSVMNGKLEIYNRISSKLKLGILGDEFSTKPNPYSLKAQQSVNETEASAAPKASSIGKVAYSLLHYSVYVTATWVSGLVLNGMHLLLAYFMLFKGQAIVEIMICGLSRRGIPKLRWEDRLKQDMKELLLSEEMTSDRKAWRDRIRRSGIPVRLYLWTVDEDFGDLEAAPNFDSWDQISYINRPVEINGEGKYFTLLDAVKSVLPEFYPDSSNTIKAEIKKEEITEETAVESVETGSTSGHPLIKLLRIQGIKPKMDIPFSWVVNNLMNPDYFLHICLYIKAPKPIST
ncbi:autophagy protein 5 [Tanacetum coccineum]